MKSKAPIPKPRKSTTPWDEIHVRSWDELIKVLHSPRIVKSRGTTDGGHRRSPYVFRGMSDATWQLVTSLERLGSAPADIEGPALRGFSKYATTGTFRRNSDWERLAVAQHNGLPTRCLDWTVAPLVAAHFATVERQHFKADGVIWCVEATILRNHLLPPKLLNQLKAERAWVYNVPLLDETFPRLGDFDATAKTGGDAMMFFEPPSIDARIQNQFAILSVMNGASKSHHRYLQTNARHPKFVRRITIDSSAKPEIRDMLDQNNITERMLFPGLPGLCDWLRRYYGP